jgi:TolB-like protein
VREGSCIQTVAGRGYRFTAPVTRVPAAAMVEASEGLPLPDKPSLAVMPFQNMSGDPEQEYFADGIVEEIITALSRIRWLFVIARNSSFAYKAKPFDIDEVGRELGVRYILEGSVRKAGGRVRITAQLIDARSGAHLWADRFDGLFEDVFDLQDKVAASVAGVIEPELQAAETARSAQRPTGDLTASTSICGHCVTSINSSGTVWSGRSIYSNGRSIAILTTVRRLQWLPIATRGSRSTAAPKTHSRPGAPVSRWRGARCAAALTTPTC